MSETQETVCRWMHETFPGADPESPRKALRALEEMVELCLAAGANYGEILAAVSKAGPPEAPYAGQATRGYESRCPELTKVPAEAADVLIVLYGLAGLRGFDIHAEVDRKMTVNRARRWAPRGDGTGYHVKDAPPPAGGADAGETRP